MPARAFRAFADSLENDDLVGKDGTTLLAIILCSISSKTS
uniref:Uncharacterized protein n=1 Tax=Arundo donax TaxID=35708 RepID=A0A0A9G686_ARUDO